jgi:hypothetical protein
MANVVKFKRSAVAGKAPATTDLQLGELALNTYDGRLYLKKSVSAVETIVAIQQITGGTGVAVSVDGVASIGQSVATTANVAFATGVFTDPSAGSNYTVKIGNAAGSVFGIGTGSESFGIANDALNNAQTGYVPYQVTATQVGFKTSANNYLWSFNADGTTQFPNYKFPAAGGTAGQILQTDGAGNISWVNNSSTQTASTTQLGVVKIDGTTITINNGVISVASDNIDLGPLFALNTAVTGANTYDTGLIFRQGSNPNVGLVYSVSGNEFRAISTIESGTTQGTVAVASYKNIATASVKITSESANKVTFTDASKVVRSLDSGRTAYVDGLMQFNSTAELSIPAGSTGQRPATPQTGSVRFNSDKMMFEGYANATWQALGIGTGSAPTYQGFVGDGTTYQFTLASAPLSAAQLMVTINGVLQEPGYSYSVSGTILSFIGSDNINYPPELNDRIDIRTLSAPSISSIQEYNYVGDGSTTTFASQYLIGSVAEVLVFVNNIYQDSAVYTVNGYNVVFSQAPFNNERVTLVHLAAMMSGAVVSPSDAFFWGLVGA